MFTLFADGAKWTTIEPPEKSILNDGDMLRCSAHGNPSPRYVWINALDNSTTEGATYVVNVCQGYQFNRLDLQCIATNHVSGKLHASSYNLMIEVDRCTCQLSTIGESSNIDIYPVFTCYASSYARS